jgi:hypothetical protein
MTSDDYPYWTEEELADYDDLLEALVEDYTYNVYLEDYGVGF